MDPITTAVVAAIAAGATAGITEAAKKTIVDGYTNLKNLIVRKFGQDSNLADAVTRLEQDPASLGRRAVLAEAVTQSNADQDAEIVAAAEQIVNAINMYGTVSIGGNNSGQAVGVNTGTMTQTNQTITNHASNQGAQGTFAGPVTFNQGSSTVFNQQGQRVQGDQYNAGRDVIRADGDYVGRDKVDNSVRTHDSDGEALARAFAQVYAAITARPVDPNVDTDEITETVRSIEGETRKGAQANAAKLRRWLRNLADMAEDIFAGTVAALTGPQAAATVAHAVAAQVQQEREES